MKVQDIEKMVQWDRDHIVRSASPVGDTRGIIFDKGDGIYLEDIKGKKYIDGASQLVCVNLGYGNKAIVPRPHPACRASPDKPRHPPHR